MQRWLRFGVRLNNSCGIYSFQKAVGFLEMKEAMEKKVVTIVIIKRIIAYKLLSPLSKLKPQTNGFPKCPYN